MGRRVFAAALVLLAVGSPLLDSPAAAQGRLPRRLDADVARALRAFQVPGAAIAIVKDGRVLLAKGYGVRRLGDPAPVDAHTLFQIASNTKAFTTACLAVLVDSGRIDWDDPVTKYLPDFALSDPWVTRELTLRDLVTHRSGLGLGAGDLLWLHSNYTRRETIHRMRAAKPASSFRSQYAYANVLYAVEGARARRAGCGPRRRFSGSPIPSRRSPPCGRTSRPMRSGGGCAITAATRSCGIPAVSRGWRPGPRSFRIGGWASSSSRTGR